MDESIDLSWLLQASHSRDVRAMDFSSTIYEHLVYFSIEGTGEPSSEPSRFPLKRGLIGAKDCIPDGSETQRSKIVASRNELRRILNLQRIAHP